MVEVKGNLWTYPADVRVITTNGFVKKDGSCVMGRGCAAEAKATFPDLPRVMGRLIEQNGNHCYLLRRGGPDGVLVSFPVKHHWFEKADTKLIEQSAHELVKLADDQAWIDGWRTIVMPRPGCGNGRLSWDRDVKPILEPILDDRFHVITF
jgi:hypothetical protein